MPYTTPQVEVNRTEVRHNPVLGRYLINGNETTTSKDTLIEELPFALGPKCNGPVMCLECYCPVKCNPNKKTNTTSCSDDRCPECGWPLCMECREQSENLKYHSQNECLVFSKNKVKFYDMSSDVKGCPQLDCITPLRYCG